MRLSKIIKGVKVLKDTPMCISVKSMLGECRLRLHIHGYSDMVSIKICIDDMVVYSDSIVGNDYTIDIPINMCMDRDISVLLGEDKVVDFIIFNL